MTFSVCLLAWRLLLFSVEKSIWKTSMQKAEGRGSQWQALCLQSHPLSRTMLKLICNDSYPLCVSVCLWANSIVWAVGSASCLHKRKLTLRKCQQLMNSSPVQQGQAVTLRTHISLCGCPFLWRWKWIFKTKHVFFIVPHNTGVLGVFSYQQHHTPPPTVKFTQRKVNQTEKWKQNMNLSFISRSQPDFTCLSPALFHLSLPFTAY